MTTLILDPLKPQNGESDNNPQATTLLRTHTTMNDSYFFQLYGLCSSRTEVLYPNTCCCSLLCNVTKSSKEAVADPTWCGVTRYGIHVHTFGNHGVHGYSQQ